MARTVTKLVTQGVITLKQMQTWYCPDRQSLSASFQAAPSLHFDLTPPQPLPLTWPDQAAFPWLFSPGDRPPVQLHLFPGEAWLLANRECWVWSPELWLSPTGLESGVTDCYERMPGSLILIMIDGEKVHGVILCCCDMRSKISRIPSWDREGYFEMFLEWFFSAFLISFEFLCKTTFFFLLLLLAFIMGEKKK